MTSYKPGDVVLVSIPFTGQSGAKKRPGVVVSSEVYNARTPDVIILPITSQIRQTPVFGEFAIAEWQAAGLLKSSVGKPLLASVEQSLVTRHLGKLHRSNEAALQQCLSLIDLGNPPALPGDSKRFDRYGGRKEPKQEFSDRSFPPPCRGRARVGVENFVPGIGFFTPIPAFPL